MISKKLAIEVLNAALETGADYAEIFYEDSSAHSVLIENGKVETSSSNSLCGVGLRLLKNNQCVYGYTNDLTKKGLLALANSLNKSFHDKRLITVKKLDMIKCKNRNPVTRSYDDVPVEEKIALIREGIDEINSLKDPRIVRTFGSFGDNHRFVPYHRVHIPGYRVAASLLRESFFLVQGAIMHVDTLGSVEGGIGNHDFLLAVDSSWYPLDAQAAHHVD